MYSSVTKSTGFLPTALLSDGQDIFPGLRTNQELLGGSTLEVTVGCDQGPCQGRPASLDHHDGASQPWHFDYSPVMITALPVGVQFGSQFNFQPYETQPRGTEEHAIIQSTPGYCKRTSTRRRVRYTCTDCNRDFSRVQEFNRHLKDVHEPRRQCPFCDFTWTRPNKIKAHIMGKHHGKLTTEQLVNFQALRGQKILAFLRVLM